jgi:hypothetical protein
MTLRFVNSATAALRLLTAGYYDESLAITRNIGEIANLFALFLYSKPALAAWRAASNDERRKRYSPVAVRKGIEELKGASATPISRERYSLLCEIATHVGPGTEPQNHNFMNIPGGVGKVQVKGLLVGINELALPIAFVTIAAPRLLEAPKELTSLFDATAHSVGKSIGIDIISTRNRFKVSPAERNEAVRKLGDTLGIDVRSAGLLAFEAGEMGLVGTKAAKIMKARNKVRRDRYWQKRPKRKRYKNSGDK